MFKYVRSNMTSKVAVPMLKRGDQFCSGSLETAELLADTFSEVYTKEDTTTAFPEIACPRIIPSLEQIIFTPENVKRHLETLKNNSSPGMDSISPLLLRRCSESLSSPLAKIMTSSFNSARVPISWKKASITPIFKKGDKLNPKNYRPISLTPIVCKIMESIIAEAVMEFALKLKIIPEQQHGFVRGRSTMTNLLWCVNKWTTALDKKEPIDVVYLDFAKAFDRVPKSRLTYKLEHLGIRGKLLDWIESFLSDRTFCVRVGQSYSSERPVLSGVPQGSVLGPLLFVLFSSDLRYHIKSDIVFYADDSKLFNRSSLQPTLQHDLDAVTRWTADWQLPLNTEKCVVLHLGGNNPRLDYVIHDRTLQSVKSHNDLGVIITENLNWSEHISGIVKRVNCRLYVIKRAFTRLTFKTWIGLFACYVRPIMEYCGSVWSAELIRDRKLLEGLQRKATRMWFNCARPDYEERLRLACLTSFEKRKLRGDLIITFRILKFNFGGLDEMFAVNEDIRLRGHSLKLRRENFKSRCRQHFLSNRIFSVWNSLPADVVCAGSVNSFKARLDQCLPTIDG